MSNNNNSVLTLYFTNIINNLTLDILILKLHEIRSIFVWHHATSWVESVSEGVVE